MDDLRSQHTSAARRVRTLALGADEAQLHLRVPATPSWDAQQLLAHLAGAASDAVHGRMDGAPGPRWSARHVEERFGLPVGDLMDELIECADTLPAFPPGVPSPLWDLLVHEADLREVWGAPRQPAAAWQTLLPLVVTFIDETAPGDGVTVTTSDGAWRAGGPTPVSLAADDYELLRVLFGRRDRAWLAERTDQPAALRRLALFGED